MRLSFLCSFFLTCFIVCVTIHSALAQSNYEGQVFDKNTDEPIPFATVTLAKNHVATRTNEQGYFSLPAVSMIDRDSLIFTCVGYRTYRISLIDYKWGGFVYMEMSTTKLKEVVVGIRRKIKKLDGFNANDLYQDVSAFWLYYPMTFYNAQSYAKLLVSPKSNAVLTSVDIGRWQPDPIWGIAPAKKSKFKIHIMTVHPGTGAPDSVLFTKEILLQDRSRKISIRLDSANIVIPATKFFIAIEWLRVPFNEYILKRGFIRKDDKGNISRNDGFDRVIYQPILAKHIRSAIQSCWQLTDGSWALVKQSNYEIAVSATINY